MPRAGVSIKSLLATASALSLHFPVARSSLSIAQPQPLSRNTRAAFLVPRAGFELQAAAPSLLGFASQRHRSRAFTSMGFNLDPATKTDHPLQTSPPQAGLRWAPPAGTKVRVVLGSKSTTRKLLLSALGVVYDTISPDIDEKAIRTEVPEALVLALANAKADALLQRPEVTANREDDTTTLLLTCDQVVVHEGRILEKPEDAVQAEGYIKGYGRAPCSTVGGIVVTNLESGKRVEALDGASIHFKDIPQNIISDLIKAGDVFYCAGGLMVEAPEIQPYLVKIEGSMDSVMGLSRKITADLLSKALQS
mmetsp:Transcript_25706/g.63382  ORF Transcript_25706/g.63382 Transcript_25706/m.63382 type:complete len:308 (+) Transcript_25706:95-1018(+)